MRIIFLWLFIVVVTPSSFAFSQFPKTENPSDENGIIEAYMPYAKYVLEIGQVLSPSQAAKFNRLFDYLMKNDRKLAASFLKGLYMEMNWKAHLMKSERSQLTTRHPQMRKWVVKYLPEWNREIDERVFRLQLR